MTRLHGGGFLVQAWLFCSLALGACATGPQLPEDLQGKAAVVLGYTADDVMPYEGGTLYTGLRISQVDGQTIGPPSMARYDYRLLEPGLHRLQGYCYWRLRGVLDMRDDLQEPAYLELTVNANTRYTIQSEIDEYKAQCLLRVVESPHP